MQALGIPEQCIYRNGDAAHYAPPMLSVYEIRRINLRVIVREAFEDNASRAAEALGFQQASLIYRYLSDNPDTAKQIGARLARKIEQLGEQTCLLA
jgi:hypothetical protein